MSPIWITQLTGSSPLVGWKVKIKGVPLLGQLRTITKVLKFIDYPTWSLILIDTLLSRKQNVSLLIHQSLWSWQFQESKLTEHICLVTLPDRLLSWTAHLLAGMMARIWQKAGKTLRNMKWMSTKLAMERNGWIWAHLANWKLFQLQVSFLKFWNSKLEFGKLLIIDWSHASRFGVEKALELQVCVCFLWHPASQQCIGANGIIGMNAHTADVFRGLSQFRKANREKDTIVTRVHRFWGWEFRSVVRENFVVCHSSIITVTMQP